MRCPQQITNGIWVMCCRLLLPPCYEHILRHVRRKQRCMPFFYPWKEKCHSFRCIRFSGMFLAMPQHRPFLCRIALLVKCSIIWLLQTIKNTENKTLLPIKNNENAAHPSCARVNTIVKFVSFFFAPRSSNYAAVLLKCCYWPLVVGCPELLPFLLQWTLEEAQVQCIYYSELAKIILNSFIPYISWTLETIFMKLGSPQRGHPIIYMLIWTSFSGHPCEDGERGHCEHSGVGGWEIIQWLG